MSECLKLHGWQEEREIQHLCRRLWGRRTCGGYRCDECNVGSATHKAMVRKAMQVLSDEA